MNHHLKVDLKSSGKQPGLDKLRHVCCKSALIGSCLSDLSGILIGQTQWLDKLINDLSCFLATNQPVILVPCLT